MNRRLAWPLSLLLLGQSGFAETSGMASLRLADVLMRQGRYREAELEYERAATETPEGKRSEIVERMVQAALHTGDYGFTLKLSRTWQLELRDTERCPAILAEGKALYALGNPEAVLAMTIPTTCSDGIRDELDLVKGSAAGRLGRWSETRSFWEQATAGPRFADRKPRVEALLSKGEQWRPRSAARAAWASAILPGAGYAYAGKPQTAAAAFFTTGLFTAATYFSARAGEPGLAAVFGLFSLAWYFGGVRGSAQAAERRNRLDLDRLLEPMTPIP